MPAVAQTYALPKDICDAGVRHWGYHGISYDYISRQIPKFAPQARRVIAAHLGGGASMCAMRDGKSIETSMGFAGLTTLLVFTAGIGEHSVPVRAALCRRLGWLGVTLDDKANASGGPRISTPDSPVSVWVIPTTRN